MSAELFSAIESGNAGRVRELLASDPAAAGVKDGEGATPLAHGKALSQHASESGNGEIASLFETALGQQ